tara:strand:+ start:845 stop:2161 length:1317 start_codon:yes stop_codon:yes gene_type:complete
MGFLPGKLSPFAAILCVAALALDVHPASSTTLLASKNYTGTPATVNDLRVGVHPDKTRIVLDVSQPTDLSYRVSKDGKSIRLSLPHAFWQAPEFQKRHARGVVTGFSQHSSEINGSDLTIKSRSAIRLKRPFFVSPNGKQGHRIVIDMVPAPRRVAEAPTTILVASLDNTGALPKQTEVKQRAKQNIEVAQIRGSQNPYIQRAFPQGTRPQAAPQQMAPQQTAPRAAPQAAPRQVMPTQQRQGFLGLQDTYFRGSIGLHMLTETSNEGASNNYDAEFSPGFSLGGAIGTALDNGFRIEGEIMYTDATLKQISGTAAGSTYNTEVVGGDMSTISFMGNVAFDFPNNSRLTPFLMGGVGIAGLFLNEFKATETAIADDMDWVFALQLGGGVTFDLDDRTKIEIGYRYFETQDPEFSDASGTPFESVYASHNFLVGVVVDF